MRTFLLQSPLPIQLAVGPLLIWTTPQLKIKNLDVLWVQMARLLTHDDGPGFKVYHNFHTQLTSKSYMLSIYFFIFSFTLCV